MKRIDELRQAAAQNKPLTRKQISALRAIASGASISTKLVRDMSAPFEFFLRLSRMDEAEIQSFRAHCADVLRATNN